MPPPSRAPRAAPSRDPGSVRPGRGGCLFVTLSTVCASCRVFLVLHVDLVGVRARVSSFSSWTAAYSSRARGKRREDEPAPRRIRVMRSESAMRAASEEQDEADGVEDGVLAPPAMASSDSRVQKGAKAR